MTNEDAKARRKAELEKICNQLLENEELEIAVHATKLLLEKITVIAELKTQVNELADACELLLGVHDERATDIDVAESAAIVALEKAGRR